MLTHLHIENYAIIELVELNINSGVTVLTGETGAGKSIILGALGLILGKRADSSVLFDKSKKSIIEAQFNIQSYKLNAFFEENDLDYEEQLIVRREINHNGKSRAFINDTPTTLKVLNALSSELVDLHQQFDTREIFETDFQREVLDALAGNEKDLNDYRSGFRQWLKDKKELKTLQKEFDESNAERDFIQFQLKEFEEIGLIEGEQQTAEENLNRLSNSEAIQSISQSTYFTIDENEQSVVNQLEDIIRSLSQYSELDDEMKRIYEGFMNAKEELKVLASDIAAYGNSINADPEKLQTISDRLELIYKLQSKHRVESVEALLEIENNLSEKVFGGDQLAKQIESLEKKIEKLETDLRKKADGLHKKRANVVSKLEKSIQTKLHSLSMKNARLNVDLQKSETINEYGASDINFLFAANMGSDFQALKQVASGGETSRLALCIKSTIADVMHLPTMIFDEIDSGVSGEVALKMGKILKTMSVKHQILSITHSPQVAASADHHFHIYKEDTKQRTYTKIRLLDKDERKLEIAKMLSGDPPSKAAIKNAEELVKL